MWKDGDQRVSSGTGDLKGHPSLGQKGPSQQVATTSNQLMQRDRQGLLVRGEELRSHEEGHQSEIITKDRFKCVEQQGNTGLDNMEEMDADPPSYSSAAYFAATLLIIGMEIEDIHQGNLAYELTRLIHPFRTESIHPAKGVSAAREIKLACAELAAEEHRYHTLGRRELQAGTYDACSYSRGEEHLTRLIDK